MSLVLLQGLHERFLDYRVGKAGFPGLPWPILWSILQTPTVRTSVPVKLKREVLPSQFLHCLLAGGVDLGALAWAAFTSGSPAPPLTS